MDAIVAPSEFEEAALFVRVPNTVFGTSVCSLMKSPFSGISSESDCQVSTCLLVCMCDFEDAQTTSVQYGGIVAVHK